nr:hypothetical protein [Providencia sp. PROV024]
MGVSIYYSATRNSLLTTTEKDSFNDLVNKLNQSFPYKDEAETLNFYEEPSQGFILEGSTKLPLEDETILMESIEYWLEALSQLTLSLPSADWIVNIEDSPASWVNDRWVMQWN